MATRPGVLIVGGYDTQGGPVALSAGISALGDTALATFGSKDLLRAVPDDPATGAPTSEFKPWWNGRGGTTYVVTAATATTIDVAGTPFSGEDYTGKYITFMNETPVNGYGFRGSAAISSNDDNTITFANPGFTPSVGAVIMVGEGVFESYHASAGWIHPTYEIGTASYRGGSAWIAAGPTGPGGLGVGMDATMVRRLYEDVYSDSPYFVCAKWSTTSRIYDGYGDSPNDSGRAALLAEIQRIEAAAAANLDTIDWKYVVIDFSSEDIKAASPSIINYLTSLTQFITWLRGTALSNTNLKIGLVSPDPRLFEITAPTAAAFVRQWHADIARTDDKVGIIDMKNRDFGDVGQGFPTTSDAADDEPTQYAYYEYLWMGEEAVRVLQRLEAATPAAPSGGFPLYGFIGDSITTGKVEISWVQAANSEELSGPNSGNNTERPSNQKQWNGSTQLVEIFDPAANANTLQSLTSTSGPELGIHAELGKIHPNGYCLLKIGSSASGMAISPGIYKVTGSNPAVPATPGGPGDGGTWMPADNENFTILEQEFAAVVQYINDSMGKQADFRGMMVSLGHNDHAAVDGGTVFAANIDSFINTLWSQFSTRTSGSDFPIAWRRPQDDTSGVDLQKINQVRAAIDLMDSQYKQFRSVNVDGLEPDREDGLHESPIMAVETGRRLVKAIQSVAI